MFTSMGKLCLHDLEELVVSAFFYFLRYCCRVKYQRGTIILNVRSLSNARFFNKGLRPWKESSMLLLQPLLVLDQRKGKLRLHKKPQNCVLRKSQENLRTPRVGLLIVTFSQFVIMSCRHKMSESRQDCSTRDHHKLT